MKRVLFAMLLVGGAAAADSSVPAKKVSGGASWQGRCAERMERARDELAKRLPSVADATVEAVALEQSVAGDPTSQQTQDTVKLHLDAGMYLMATVIPSDASGQVIVLNAGTKRPLLEKTLRRAVDDCLAMVK